jgi:hypothetical protein
MRIASLGLLLIISCAASAQAVWKYVDEQGVTHYTDQPVPGAQKIELRSGSAAASAADKPASTATTTNNSQKATYRTFEIVKPADQESVVNTGGVLQVSMTLAPSVQGADTVQLYLDGKLVEGYPRNVLDYELQNVPRGVHTLIGVIQDANNRRVFETSKVTFTMRQKSIAVQPPVGPALRPPTKAPTTPRAPAQSSQPAFADLHPKRAAAGNQ